MSLPLQAIERLFERLTATYGRSFWNAYEGVDPAAVKTVWAHELSGFVANLKALAWALENLPERAPNAIEFRNIARRAPLPDMQRLAEPSADPDRLRSELEKLSTVRAKFEQPKIGTNTAWAHAILAKREAGIPVAHAVYRMAKEVADRYPRAA